MEHIYPYLQHCGVAHLIMVWKRLKFSENKPIIGDIEKNEFQYLDIACIMKYCGISRKPHTDTEK
jgi:hypothetical protein